MQKGGTLEVYWSEDFSNGFEGQEENGLWTTLGEQGSLWFHTFPVGSENGYDPDTPIEGYGDFLPNYFDNGQDVVSSPTRDNGIMMLDADRYNSTSASPDDDPGPNTTDEPIVASLVTPGIDLTGIEYADLCFYAMSFMCCQVGRQTNVDISFDDEESWQEVDSIWVGPNLIDQEYCIELSSFLLESTDNSNVKIRFRWPENITHYYWMLDDIRIQAIPENDLVAGATWYNNYHELVDDFEESTISASEYYDAFEYLSTPDYLTRPFNFAMEITNEGPLPQTGVELRVTVTTPSETTLPDFQSDPITIEPTLTDTLEIGPITFGDGPNEIPLEDGEYTFDFLVVQNEEDEFPGNNMGESRECQISDDDSNDGFAVFRNDGDSYNGAYLDLSEGTIWGTVYTFPGIQLESLCITHIETVLQFNEDFAETTPGQVIYFNLRKGSILNEDSENPESITTVVFDSANPLNYELPELSLEITESDIWDYQTDSLPYTVWASFELPSQYPITPGEIYQAEFRVPSNIEGAVFPAVTSNQERYSSFVFDESEQEWYQLENNAIPIRFRTSSYCPLLSVENVNFDKEIQLLQNYPNPFSDITRIEYRLDETSDVTFEVFDLSGRLIYSEDHGRIPAGIAQTFEFDAKSMSSGVYTYSIVSNGERVTRKLTIE